MNNQLTIYRDIMSCMNNWWNKKQTPTTENNASCMAFTKIGIFLTVQGQTQIFTVILSLLAAQYHRIQQNEEKWKLQVLRWSHLIIRLLYYLLQALHYLVHCWSIFWILVQAAIGQLCDSPGCTERTLISDSGVNYHVKPCAISWELFYPIQKLLFTGRTVFI